MNKTEKLAAALKKELATNKKATSKMLIKEQKLLKEQPHSHSRKAA